MLRKTKIILETRWDDEWSDHPVGWDWQVLVATHPEKGERVRLIDYSEEDDENV